MGRKEATKQYDLKIILKINMGTKKKITWKVHTQWLNYTYH